MNRKKALLFLPMALLVLSGQGCPNGARLDLNVNGDTGDKIDAAVNADLNAAESIDKTNKEADEDADAIDTDDTELNSYTELNYDLP